jgi:hypothetical protein
MGGRKGKKEGREAGHGGWRMMGTYLPLLMSMSDVKSDDVGCG